MSERMTESEYDERVAAQTKALRGLGFDAAFHITDGFFGLGAKQAATCGECSALVLIEFAAAHHAWHYPTPGSEPAMPNVSESESAAGEVGL